MMNLISWKNQFLISNKYKFLQQNYRVFLIKELNLSRNISVLSHNEMVFEWKNIGLIDLIYFDSDEFIKCPICLESDLLVPKISSCGHIYCWPCIIKLMNSILENDEYAKKFNCPICFSNVFLNELISLRYQIVKRVQLGSEINLCLLFRNIASPFIHFETSTSHSKKVLLEKNDKGAQFQRFGLISDQIDVLICDLQMLRIRKFECERKGSNEEISCIEECISIIENSLKLKGVVIPKYELFSNNSLDLLVSKYRETELLEELVYSFVNSTANFSSQNDIKNLFYFYQLIDGQLVFLEPFCVKVLQTEFGTIENLPKVLLNVLVTSIKELTLNHINSRKYKFLSHIPMGSTIYIVGIDLTPFITTKTKEIFREELDKRLNRTKPKQYTDITGSHASNINIDHSITSKESISSNRSCSCYNEEKSNQLSVGILEVDFPVLTSDPNVSQKANGNDRNKVNIYKSMRSKNSMDQFPPVNETF